MERLAESGEERAVRLAHAGYAIALGEQADRDAAGGVYRPWFARLAAEQGNLRAALAWLEATKDVDRTLQLAGAIWPLWYVQGPYYEERALLERVPAAGSTAPFDVRGRATFGAGILAITQGDLGRAEARFAVATSEARSLGYALGTSGGLLGLAWVAIGRGELDRAAWYQREGPSLARELDSGPGHRHPALRRPARRLPHRRTAGAGRRGQSKVTIGVGDSVLLPMGASGELRGSGTEPASVMNLTVASASSPVV